MQIKSIVVVGCVVSLLSAPVFGKDKKGNGEGKGEKSEVGASAAQAAGKGAGAEGAARKEPWVGIDVRIGAPEKEVIREYVHTRSEPAKGKKSKGLPPGLAKKVARGGELPPGWQKKVVRGEVLPVEVYKECHPLPKEVTVKLPAPPEGTILVAVSGKVVRLAKATREILDVFDVR